MITQIYQLYFQELLYYTTGMTSNRSEAEDIVQESFLRALEHSDTFDSMENKQCRAWLYKTARNIFIDRMRRKNTVSDAAEEGITEEDFTRVEVLQLCGELPEEERRLFIQRYFEGYDATRLGKMYGVPPSTIRAKLASARRKLRRKYPELEPAAKEKNTNRKTNY